jgi:hypothetical protein
MHFAQIAFTPDRGGKKIVELSPGELSWATNEDMDPSVPVMHFIPGKGLVSVEEWEESQLQSLAGPFIEAYKRNAFPDDRLIVLHENGGVSEYPLVNV